MPASTVTQNQVNQLESGLKYLKHSKLMNITAFKDMYNSIEVHHRDIKLAHLTGKAKDLLEQAHQDTQFYYILVRMLNEVSGSKDRYQTDNLQMVHAWYLNNKHVLHTGSRFGKAKKQLEKCPVLKQGTPRPVTAERGPLKSENVSKKTSEGKSSPTPHQDKPQEVKDENAKTSTEGEIKGHQQMTMADADAGTKQAPCPVKSVAIKHKTDPLEPLLPKRMPMPLCHLVNPLSSMYDLGPARSEGDAASDVSTPVRIRLVKPGQSSRGLGPFEYRNQQMKKWDAYQQESAYGQNMLGKLQHMGRSGTPYDVRYTAHDRGLMAEEYTSDVISHYISQQQGQTPNSVSVNPKMLVEQPLEEFYDTAEGYYPQKLPKYPSFKAKSARSKTSRSGESNGDTDRSQVQTPSQKGSSDVGEECSDMKLDTVVNIIDSVTDQMYLHKEKLIPDPQPGFRQPMVGVENVSRPKTAPGSTARPPTPDMESSGQLINFPHLHLGRLSLESLQDISSHYNVHFRREPPTPKSPIVEAIDWRGKVAPDSVRYKWAKTNFGGHTYVKKMSRRPKSSLRSAGSTSAGKRPKTAPLTTSDKWKTARASDHNVRIPQAASHMTTEVDPEACSQLVQVNRLGGRSPKYRSRYGSPTMWDRELFRSTTPPTMEFLSISRSMQGSRAASTIPPDGHHCTELDFDMSRGLGPSIHVPTPEDYLGGVPDDFHVHIDGDSVLAEVEHPDMKDVEDEMDRLSNHSNNLDFDDDTDPPEVKDNGLSNGEKDADYDENFPPLSGPETPRHNPDKGNYTKGDAGDYFSARQLIEECRNLARQELEEDEVKTEEEVRTDRADIDTNSGDLGTESPNGERPFAVAGITLKHGQAPKSGSRGGARLVKPHPQGCQKQPLRPSDHWSFSPDTENLNADREQFVQELRSSTPGIKVRFGELKLGRANLRPDTAPVQSNFSEDIANALKVKGQGHNMRSAGKVPVRARSANNVKILKKQQEMLRRTPTTPYRTPPSIPSVHGVYGGRSPRAGHAFSIELELHARKDKSPRHFMEKVGDLRKDSEGWPYSDKEPPVEDDISSSLTVMKIGRAPDRHGTGLPPVSEYCADSDSLTDVSLEESQADVKKVRQPRYPPPNTPTDQIVSTRSSDITGTSGSSDDIRGTETVNRNNLTKIGRPIAHYLEVNDPTDVAEAVQRQKEAKAAVDIQKNFRGYVARNNYKFLLKEEREKKEDERRAAIEIQRTYRGHLARKRAIYKRAPNPATIEWAREYKVYLADREQHRRLKAQIENREKAQKKAEADAYIDIIGPHVDIYQNFHPKKTGPDKMLLYKAAVIIQRLARGWIIRRRFLRLKRKVKMHGSTWGKFVTQYRDILRRIQIRRGVEKPQVPFTFHEVNEFMDSKRRYEVVFEKRAFGGELELDDLTNYFNECDRYPSVYDIDEAFDLVLRGQPMKKGRGLYKNEVIELAFQLYPPKAAGLDQGRQSTWMNPIIDGEEAVKLMGTSAVEPTDFETCFKLVAKATKERRERLEQETQNVEEKNSVTMETHDADLSASESKDNVTMDTKQTDPDRKESKKENTHQNGDQHS